MSLLLRKRGAADAGLGSDESCSKLQRVDSPDLADVEHPGVCLLYIVGSVDYEGSERDLREECMEWHPTQRDALVAALRRLRDEMEKQIPEAIRCWQRDGEGDGFVALWKEYQDAKCDEDFDAVDYDDINEDDYKAIDPTGEFFNIDAALLHELPTVVYEELMRRVCWMEDDEMLSWEDFQSLQHDLRKLLHFVSEQCLNGGYDWPPFGILAIVEPENWELFEGCTK